MSPIHPDVHPLLAEADDIRQELGDTMNALAADVVPWLYANLPAYYFRTHSREERIRHLAALSTARLAQGGHQLKLSSGDGRRVTYVSRMDAGQPHCGSATLVNVLAKLRGQEISAARMYASQDVTQRLDTFSLGPPACVRGQEQLLDDVLENADLRQLNEAERAAFNDFMAAATPECVEQFDAGRALRHFRLAQEVGGGDRVVVTSEAVHEDGGPAWRVSLGLRLPTCGVTRSGTSWGSSVLATAAKVLHVRELEISRAYADVYLLPGDPLFICSFYIKGVTGLEDEGARQQLHGELALAKWYAGQGLEVLFTGEGLGLKQVMFLQAAAEFAHQFLLYADPYAYTADNVTDAVLENRNAATALVELFEARFTPSPSGRGRPEPERLIRARGAFARARDTVTDKADKAIFGAMECLVEHCLRTNYRVPGAFGLSFRLDPAFLAAIPGVAEVQADIEKQSGERPYGIYFFHGPAFLGFHVRYREMARGGVRVVAAKKRESFELESNRLFDEVTALARSQQFKNKDIPEGGAKAVLLVGPEGDIDLAVKSMAESLLDIIPLPEGEVDYLGKDEIIYLGPDERIQPKHIDWIVDRAEARGYPYPAAIMSSKPRTGINHKEYGVTSLGVAVFTEEILKLLGIDPRREPFRVKLTGGPRGDVAGNLMRILMDDYGDNAKIVATSDGHGAAHDPEGLDHGELKRLIKTQQSISHFDSARLSGAANAQVGSADTPEGAKLRDELHFTARADVFVPAGGRPDTINTTNYERFFSGGMASARAIVEGANLFLSEDARAALEAKGVLAVPGASANKAGVICSSYEILAGLVLSGEEFLAVKEQYVAEVLDILRARAGDEARRLVAEYRAAGGRKAITPMSVRLSKEINATADAIYAALCKEMKTIQDDPQLFAWVLSYCPPLLAENYAERIAERVPLRHLLALASHFAAATMVYNEGLGWASRMSSMAPAERVMRAYLSAGERLDELRGLANGLVTAAPESGADLLDLLRSEGRKHLTSRELGLG